MAREGEPAPAEWPRCSFEDLLRTLREFVLVLGPRGDVEGLWSSSRDISDVARSPLLGRRVHEVLDATSLARLVQWLDRAAHGERQETEYSVQLADGLHCFLVWVMPVAHAAGRATSCCVFARDVTARKATHEALVKSEALLRKAEEIGRMGGWEISLETGDGSWSDHLYRLFGLDPKDGPITKERLLALVHPDDRERISQLPGVSPWNGEYQEHEGRFILPDGRVRTFRTRAVPITDATGRVTHLVGLSEDITDRKREEDRLRKSEALLAHAEQIANFGSWEYHYKTGEANLSRHLLHIYGLASPEEWNLEAHWGRVPRKDRGRVRRIVERALERGRPFVYMARYTRPNGRGRVHFVRGVPIAGANGKAEAWIGVVQDITDHTRAMEGLRRLSRQVMRVRDEERRAAARELHESAGQSLAALKMTLGQLRQAVPKNNPRVLEILQSCDELANAAANEVRTVSYLMHPPLLDEAGIGPAVQWYARGFAERSGIDMHVEIAKELGRQPKEIETTAFRIVQEALTNVYRYSGSRTAFIRLAPRDEGLLVEIRDEGRGLAPPHTRRSANAPAGVGIAGMRERVEQLKGVLEIESARGRGTTVRAILPLRQETETLKVTEETEGVNAKQRGKAGSVFLRREWPARV
ncbi:MAG: PAS domain S-box protein [Candidatus Acidiferrales bacterium]|jgi:PAS domain S-box-containing protein